MLYLWTKIHRKNTSKNDINSRKYSVKLNFDTVIFVNSYDLKYSDI